MANESKNDNEMKVKLSYGLACCKYINGRLHVLMIKKKYTYSFFEFVFGKYPRADRNKLESLFNTMTYQEKSDILEMDFDKLWCKIVLNIPEDPNSINKSKIKIKRPTGKKRFDLVFQEGITDSIDDKNQKEKEWTTYITKRQRFRDFIDDGGRRLKELINHSKSSDPIWEVPKGRPDGDEKPIDTANREFTEETAGCIDNYRVIYEIAPIKVNYMNSNCFYKNEYFVALADINWIPQVQFNCYEYNREVEELRWVSSEEIKYLNRGQHTYARMINLLNMIEKVMKPHHKINRIAYQ